MRKLTLVMAILVSTKKMNAQEIKISFDSLDTKFSNNVYLIDCTEMGNLNIGSSYFLFDSVVMSRKKGMLQLSSNSVNGFYRIQNVPKALPPYAFLNLIPSSMYIYLDRKSHRHLSLHLNCNNGYAPIIAHGIDADNQELILTQELINKESAILIKKISAVKHYGRDQLFADHVRLLCRLFTQAHSDIVKIFLSQQIHQAAEVMDIQTFHELVPIDFMNGYTPEFMRGELYHQFYGYVRK